MNNKSAVYLEEATKTILVALVGPPNVGKSTLFNALTGLHQKVANWPGKTVELKEGHYKKKNYILRIVDLPGIYSLTTHSEEERIARDFILINKPDVIVAVIDVTSLERGLYLLSELLLLECPVVVALNMIDLVERLNKKIEPHVLQAALNIPVVPISAILKLGFDELIQNLIEVVEGKINPSPKLPEIRDDHKELMSQLCNIILPYIPTHYPINWIIIKTLEGDEQVLNLVHQWLRREDWEKLQKLLTAHDDSQVAVVSGRYEWINRMMRAAVANPQFTQIDLTERLDKWVTHPTWGLVILMLVLLFCLGFTYLVGVPLQELFEQGVEKLSNIIKKWLVNAPEWINGLIINGIINGAGTVFTFIPILSVYFVVLGILEDSGYLARMAFVMDRFMHIIGLHGRSFLPLVLGLGCNVPAIMSTRIIDSPMARLLTVLLVPFIPCAARLGIIVLLGPVFFGQIASLVIVGLIMSSFIVMILAGVVLRHFTIGNTRTSFVMQLPLYHLPYWRTVIMYVYYQLVAFIKKAATFIVLFSIIIWALSYFPTGTFEQSILAKTGQILQPIAEFMGWDWRLLTALLSSFAAKENAIATLAILVGGEEGTLGESLRASYGPATGLSFLAALLVFIPCMGTLVAMRGEIKSWKWIILNVGLMLILAILIGAIVYKVGSFIL